MRKPLCKPISILLTVLMVIGIFTILPITSAGATGTSTDGWVFSTSDGAVYDMSGKYFSYGGETIAFTGSGSFDVDGDDITLCGQTVATYDETATNSGNKNYGTYQKEFAGSVYVTGAGLAGSPFVFTPNYIYSCSDPEDNKISNASAIAIDQDQASGSNVYVVAIANPGDGFKKYIRIKTGKPDYNNVQFLPETTPTKASNNYLAVGKHSNSVDAPLAYGVSYKNDYLQSSPRQFKDQDTATLYYVGQTNDVFQFAENRAFRKSFDSTNGDPYIITWRNDDGTLLDIGAYAAGELPEYTGETPTKAATEWYEYEFIGWDPEVTAVDGNKTYTAQFEQIQTAEHHVSIDAKIFSTSDDTDYSDQLGGKYYRYETSIGQFADTAVDYLISVSDNRVFVGDTIVATITETASRSFAGTVCVTGTGEYETPYVFTPNYIYGNSGAAYIKDGPVAHIHGTPDNKDAGVAIPGDGFIGSSKIRIGADSLAKFLPGDSNLYGVNGTKGYLGIGKTTYGNNYSLGNAKPKSFTGNEKILYYFGQNTVTVSSSSKNVYMFSEYTPPLRNSFSDDVTDIYNVTWLNYDGTELAHSTHFQNTVPRYKGETAPYKPREGTTVYTQTGWTDGTTTYTDALPPVTADATYTAVFGEATQSLFAGYTLTLSGDIGVNFWLNVSKTEVEKLGVTVDFSWDSGAHSSSYTVTPADLKDGCYKATCWVVAAEMNYPITATVKINGVTQDETATQSVRGYADVILADPSAYAPAGKTAAQLTDIIQKMLDYGAKAQTHFGRTNVPLANTGLDYSMTDITSADISGSKGDMAANIESYGLTYVGTSIIYLSQTTLRHYYKAVGGAVSDEVKAAALASGFEFGTQGSYVYFEKKNIGAADLDTVYTISFGGTEDYHFSVHHYLKLVLDSGKTTTNEKKLAMATYWYSLAANDYFGH